jgi:hypothetical protein
VSPSTHERLEHGSPRYADDGVDLPDRPERFFKRGLVGNVHGMLTGRPRDRNNLMIPAQSRGDGPADGSRRVDDQIFMPVSS